jgi:hypothetical protein
VKDKVIDCEVVTHPENNNYVSKGLS